MKKVLQTILKILAQAIVKKYQPQIVGITGSIGKTSTKEAIDWVLKDKFRVRTSFKNYNNEIGLPLVIIGKESPQRSLGGWLKVFLYSLRLLIIKSRQYPEILILEMGVDRPGDMDYLTKIAKPKIGLITYISHSHLEYFGNLANIKKEKQVLIEKLDSQGLAVLNYDSELSRSIASVSKAKVLTFGLTPGADLLAQDIVYNFSKGGYELSGVNFKLNYQGSIVPVVMKNVMSETAIYAALAATAVGIQLGLGVLETAQRLKEFNLPKGRMNLLAGIKHSFLIDDTYNSSPEASLAAVSTLAKIKIDEAADKYAVLGEMLEIGSYSEEGHQLVGRLVATSKIKYLITVGEKARDFRRGARQAGMKDDFIFYFAKPEEAGKFLQDRIKLGDVILVKGSQGARMEKIVKELMAEPDLAPQLLVRQGQEWSD
ncbi:MAG: UDP-N-acetylmuramoyl-tripeptide--D-alanyl-D-alanine ligase [Patescibacteria group bacterium]|jgi:UDP-N-acetylmuramoyl-tripeptide--D-alanyl-D-alanine ligase